MFLTRDETIDLTGFVKPSAQIRWLRENRWPFSIDGNGRPVILRTVAVDRLGGKTANTGEPKLRFAS